MQNMNLDYRLMKYQKYLKQDSTMLQALQMCLRQNNAEFTAEDRMFLHTFAPAVVNFTLWVIREAAKSGKKRLYFLARDGYYMYHAARMLGIEDIEYRYLKLSRYCPLDHLVQQFACESFCNPICIKTELFERFYLCLCRVSRLPGENRLVIQ